MYEYNRNRRRHHHHNSSCSCAVRVCFCIEALNSLFNKQITAVRPTVSKLNLMELSCVHIPGQIISVYHFTLPVLVIFTLLLHLICVYYLFSLCLLARLVNGCGSLLLFFFYGSSSSSSSFCAVSVIGLIALQQGY